MVTLVNSLGQKTNIGSRIAQAFGKYLFSRFTIGYSSFFKDIPSAMDFLSGIEDYIHVGGYILMRSFPFEIERPDAIMKMIYRSERIGRLG